MKHLSSILLCLLVCLLPKFCYAEQYALLIGIDKYSNKAFNLDGCVADVHGVAEALQTKCGYRAENIQLLTGEGKTQVTRREILDAVAQMAKRVRMEDTVFFFWSGHGSYLNGEDRVQPYETDARDPVEYEHSTLTVDEMLLPLRRTPCKALLLFFNMCRSDANQEVALLAAPDIARSVPRRRAGDFGGPLERIECYSSQEGQSSWMWLSKKRSLFGYSLEQGLLGAAADAHGEISIEALVGYVQKSVLGIAWHEGRPAQMPYVIASVPGALRFVVASGLPPGRGGATAVPANVGSSVEERFTAVFQAATEQWYARHFEEARVKFAEAVELKPDDMESVVGLAESYKFLQRFEEAERYYRRAIELQPKMGAIMDRLAGILCREKKYEEAEKLLQQAVKLSPKHPETLYSLGDFYATYRNDDKKAIPLFLRAIQADPAEPAFQVALANAYLRLQNYTEAENLYRKIMEVHPDYAAALGGLGYIMHTVKHNDAEAERLYLRAVALDPNDVWLQVSLGDIYVEKKSYAEAEKHFRDALTIDPTDPRPLKNLGYLFYETEKYSTAEAFYRKVLALDPQDVASTSQIGSIRYILDDYSEAEKWYRKAIELEPMNADIHANLAQCLVESKQRDAAIVEAKKARELGSKDARIDAILGTTAK